MSSRMAEAKKIKQWIVRVIMPSLRKYGYYKLKDTTDKEVLELTNKINYLYAENEKLKQDTQKYKYPNGGIVYVIDYSTQYESIYRIGMTNNMTLRKKIYNTHTLHNHTIIHTHESNCPRKIEACVRISLVDYKHPNKDFYYCPIETIIYSIDECVNLIDCVRNNCDANTGKKKSTINKNKIKTDLVVNQVSKHNLKSLSKKLQKLIQQ
jgi:prophage antirepressor-like protein